MWLVHDGSPAHFRQEVREYLIETYWNKWLEHGGPTAWPLRYHNPQSRALLTMAALKNQPFTFPKNRPFVIELEWSLQIPETRNIFGRVRESHEKTCQIMY